MTIRSLIVSKVVMKVNLLPHHHRLHLHLLVDHQLAVLVTTAVTRVVAVAAAVVIAVVIAVVVAVVMVIQHMDKVGSSG